MRRWLVVARTSLMAVLLGVLPGRAEIVDSGTLVFDLKALESGVKLKKDMLTQLSRGGLNWAIIGNDLVIPLVDPKHLKAPMTHGTHFGEQQVVDLLPGEYHITCIGYLHDSNSHDMDKVRSKSAFFNEGIVAFNV